VAVYEGPVQDLIDELGRLPGVGPKSAQRLAFHLLASDPADVRRLADALLEVKVRARFCSTCGNVSEEEQCRICRDPRRDDALICVVEEPKDVVAIERTREFRGRYHVLGGAISPLDGIGPEQLRVRELIARLNDGAVTEIILAMDPNIEGDATAAYLTRMLVPMGLTVTRLASGLPVGGDLEYADEITLGRAFAGRRSASEWREEPVSDFDIEDFAQQIADQAESYLVALQAISREEAGGSAVPLLLLEVSQILLAGARLGAQSDFGLEEEFQPDVGPDPDLDAMRERLAALLDGVDAYVYNFDPYDPELVGAKLSDELTSIATALANGLRHFRAGNVAEALWWWQFSYGAHWGNEASGALRALQSIVSHDRLDTDIEGEQDVIEEASAVLDSAKAEPNPR